MGNVSLGNEMIIISLLLLFNINCTAMQSVNSNYQDEINKISIHYQKIENTNGTLYFNDVDRKGMKDSILKFDYYYSYNNKCKNLDSGKMMSKYG